MPFDTRLFLELKDSSTEELKILLGGALLKMEHGMLNLHEEHEFRPLPGHDHLFVHQHYKKDPIIHHIINDPYSGSAESVMEAQLPVVEYCLDDKISLERADSFIEKLDFFEMESLYELLESKKLLGECTSGIVLAEAIYNFIAPELNEEIPLEALSIVLGRCLIKKRFR